MSSMSRAPRAHSPATAPRAARPRRTHTTRSSRRGTRARQQQRKPQRVPRARPRESAPGSRRVAVAISAPWQAASLWRAGLHQGLLRRCRLPNHSGFAFLRRTQRRGARGFRRGRASALAGRASSSARRTCTPWPTASPERIRITAIASSPRDARRLTGGSSSGGAASVQEQSALAAIGTDTGGSIRRAGRAVRACGISRVGGAGPPERIVARRRAPRAYVRYVGMAVPGSARRAAAWRKRCLECTYQKSPKRASASAACATSFCTIAMPHVLAGFAEWKKKLSDSGATIIPADTGYWDEALEINAAITAHEAAAIHSPKTGGDFSHFPAPIAQRLAWGASLSPDEIALFRSRHAAFPRARGIATAPIRFLPRALRRAARTRRRRRSHRIAPRDPALHRAHERGWRPRSDAAHHHRRRRAIDRAAPCGRSATGLRESGRHATEVA